MKKFYDIDKQSTFKKRAYTLLYEFSRWKKDNNLILRLAIFLETIQLCWYSIAPKFVHNPSAKQWLEKALHAIQIDNALDKNNEKALLSLMYIACGWQFLCVLFGLLAISRFSKANSHNFRGQSSILKFLQLSCAITSYLLALPIFQIYLTVIICVDERQAYGELVCYKGMYFLHFFFALLGIVMHIITGLPMVMLYGDINPFSNAPHASSNNKPLVYRFWIKLFLPLLALLTYKTKSLSIIVYIYAILWLGAVIYRWRQTPDVKKFTYSFRVGSEVLLLWLIIYELVRLGIDSEADDASISVIFFLCCPLVVYGVNHFIKQRANGYKVKQIKDFAKDTDVEMYLNIIIDLIKKRKHVRQWMELEGLVNHHIRHCTIPTCGCLQLSRNDDDNNQNLTPEEDERIWYRWVHDLIDVGLERFPKSAKLHLLSAFVQHDKLKNTFKALYEIEITETLNRKAEEDFSCFFYKSLIEQEIIDNDEKEKESKGTEFSKTMAFHDGFTELEGLLSEAIGFYIDFWSELLENSPHITRLYNFGSQVVDYTDIIMKKYLQLNLINPNHVRLHQAYGDFTKIVTPDSNESSKAFEKLENDNTVLMTRHQIDTQDLRYLEEDQGRFIIISGSYKNPGIVYDIGPSIPEMFGYSKAELINRNINNIMPKIFAEVHDKLLSSYLLNISEKQHDFHRNKLVYVLNKDGYLVPCDVVIYILPTLREEVRLAGFFKRVDDQFRDELNINEGIEDFRDKAPYYIVYNADTHLIQGISQNCWTSFGISSRLVEGNEGIGDVGIEDIFIEFARLDQGGLKSEEGIETTIDTSKLSQYHFISEQVLKEVEDNIDEEEDQGSEMQMTRFRQARVLVKMVSEADYFGNRVQVLRFTEVYEESQRVHSPRIIKKHEGLSPGTRRNQIEAQSQDDDEQSTNSLENDIAGEGSIGSVNEDLKIMKELRILFANKQSSRVMRVLMVVLGLFFLLLIGLAALQLKMMTTQVEEFSDILSYTMLSFNRYRSIGDVNTILRQYQTITLTRKVGGPAYEAMYSSRARNRTLSSSTLLSNFQYNLIQTGLKLDGTSFVQSDIQPFTFELFIDEGVVLQKKLYLDGLYQYLTAIDQVRNASLDSLVNPQSSVDPAIKSFKYALRNGYGPLREGAEEMIDNFDKYHSQRKDYYDQTFMIILIVTEITIAIAAVISVPFGFAAFQTKDKIIALFGYIPISDIEFMIEKSERYKEEYLPVEIAQHDEEDSYHHGGNSAVNKINHNVSYQARSPDESQIRSSIDESEGPDLVNIDENIQVQQLSPLPLSTRGPITTGYRQTTMDIASPRDPLMTNSARYLLGNSHHQQMSERHLVPSPRSSSEDVVKGMIRRKSMFDNDEKRPPIVKEKTMKENREMDIDKLPKYIRPEKGNKKAVILIVIAGTLFWVSIFIISYVFFEKWFLNQMEKMFSHISLNMGRTCHLTYLNGFIYEEIANPDLTALYTYPRKTEVVNLREKYRKITEEENSLVMTPEKLDLPATFSEYLSLLKEINTGNICPFYSTIASEITICEQFANGLMKNGVRMIILSNLLTGDTLAQNARDKFSQIDLTNSTQVNSTILSLILSSEYTQSARILSYINPVLTVLRGHLAEAKDGFFDNCKAIGVSQFIGYLMLCIVMYALVWYQSSRGLGNRIIKAKRMLNMMPMEFVLNNDLLKDRVLSKDIHHVLA